MGRVLLLGIDAMDSDLLARFEPELPHLSRLMASSPSFRLTSVYPPDTPTAWASIFTGLNPARHGVVFFVDPLEKVSILSYQDVDNASIRGKTMWDIAGKAGKRVCLLFPELGYPVWPVNGVMVARSNQRYGKVAPVQAFPPAMLREYPLLSMRKIKTVPKKRGLEEYIAAYRRLVAAETEFGLRLWREGNWDLFFLYSNALDWVGHNLWSYFDPQDPAYRGANPYENVFRDFYRQYDEMVGRFMAAASGDTQLVVLSDHGQGMRPRKMVNINEFLRVQGLLSARIKRRDLRDRFYLLEVLKRSLSDWLSKHGAGGLVMRLLYFFPSLRRFYSSPRSIDWENTIAYVSDLSGIKSYAYGGIMINRSRIGDTPYEALCQQLIDDLKQLREPETGEPLVKWVCHREQLYAGEHLNRYPDIVFHLRNDYGVGWSVHDSVVAPLRRHSLQPGSHRMDTPVFLASVPPGMVPRGREMTLMDVAPTVLHLLGVKGEDALDGTSVFLETAGA